MQTKIINLEEFIDFDDPVFRYIESSYEHFTLGSDLHGKILDKIDAVKFCNQVLNSDKAIVEHENNDILNLPWEDILAPTEEEHPEIFFYRTHKLFYSDAEFIPFQPPLRVLVVISSPEDIDAEYSLDFEDEELKILEAFEPFILEGKMELEFLEDGVFENLLRKLDERQYHILHVTSHGIFHEGNKSHHSTLFEKKGNYEMQKIEDAAFAAINNGKYRVPFVFMSTCHSARGVCQTNHSTGLVNQFLKQGPQLSYHCPLRSMIPGAQFLPGTFINYWLVVRTLPQPFASLA